MSQQMTQGWQPIDTAPKDRTIDCHNGGTRFTNCQWSPIRERFEFTAFDGGRYDTEATHWMDIPAPPKAQSQPPSESWRYFRSVHGWFARTGIKGLTVVDLKLAHNMAWSRLPTVSDVSEFEGHKEWTEITAEEAENQQPNQ